MVLCNPFCLWPAATGNHLSAFCCYSLIYIFSFLEFYINGIMQYELFCVYLLSLSLS